ncbi:MAG: N-(5'-phosphoribosyl)anthranilate isomerase [Verrucomicrobia bacterium ADurb.Bin474]|nr:MAG: N-(5'-phosphoribosyl)anthranilate isomerase [Verrucomicrobia bacterium ADurb.Bin474]
MPRTPIHIKICGIRRAEDALLALELGASYIGCIHHPASPRHLGIDGIRALCRDVPLEKRVLVVVEPEPDQLRELSSIGFAAFQVHVKDLNNKAKMVAWIEAAESTELWLAPRLPPEAPFPEHLLDVASTWVIDTYSPTQTGGTGKTGDWPAFRQWNKAHPSHRFILAGGISPTNILEAARVSLADWIDVNSGVEEAPGKKDHDKLRSLFSAIRNLA